MNNDNLRKASWGVLLTLLIAALLFLTQSLSLTGKPQSAMRQTGQAGVSAGALAARTPTPQPTVAVPGNLLVNPSLEEPYQPQGAGEVNAPHGWKAWYLDIPPCKPWRSDCFIPCPSNCIENGACLKDYGCMWARPEFVSVLYDQYAYRVHSGRVAAKYFSYGRMHQAGYYQQVTGLTPGTLVEFSAWIQTWMCFNYDNCDFGRKSDLPSDMHIKIGIDPTGGIVPTSTNIIWSAEVPAFDQWVYLSMQARAQSSTITVFTHSRPEWTFARANNDVYVDDANLVIAGPPAEFLIEPAQPELGQLTLAQVQSNVDLANPALTITDPNAAPVTPTGGVKSGSGPFAWTWQFTPTVPGDHALVFTSTDLPAPVTMTVHAIATARLSAQPGMALLNQPVQVQVSAYYPYASQRLTVTNPAGGLIATTDEGITGTYVHTWNFASLMTGTHRITFTADLIPAPLTATVNVASVVRVNASPPAPPSNTPVTIQALAYYPYTGIVLTVTDPQGQPLAPNLAGQSSGPPLVWTWVVTPSVSGIHVYTVTANLLDTPATGLIFVDGDVLYLPIVFR